MDNSISFVLDDRLQTLKFDGQTSYGPTTTVLNFLRAHPGHKGVKEGCAEGDCGACTVVLAEPGAGGRLKYTAVDSCLVFLPVLHGKQLLTVENLRDPRGNLHPVQQAMVDRYGSQCGYCTPGIIMAMFALYKNRQNPSQTEIEDSLTGNLCRCTGYRPIIDAAKDACTRDGSDHLSDSESDVIRLLRSVPVQSLRIRWNGQEYYRPVTLGEAISLKHRFPEAILITGGTDVALRVTKKHELLKIIIDCSGVPELRTVDRTADAISIGAGLPLNDVAGIVKEENPAIYRMLEVFGSRQIRNTATLGGNLGTASPIGDLLPILIASGAKIVLEGLNGRRVIECDGFVTGYRSTVRKDDEIIVSVILPKLAPGTTLRSYKISKRKDLDISTVSGGFRLVLGSGNRVREIVLAYGGMAAVTKRAAAAEKYLLGKTWTRGTIDTAMPVIDTDFSPLSDARGSAAFRTLAARNLLLKFWSETNDGMAGIGS